MVGDTRSTSINVSGRIGPQSEPLSPPAVPISVVDPQAAKVLSEGFFLVGRQLTNLNAMLLNGIPLQVHVSTPPPVNNITVEPPFVRVEPPVVRVDNQAPTPPSVFHETILPAPYFSKDEMWALVGALFVFLIVLTVGMVMIGIRLWSQPV